MGGRPARERSVDWPLWGGTARLVLRGPGDLKTARAAVDAVVMAVDEACSRFRTDSEVSRLAIAGGERIPVSPLLARAVAEAVRAAQLTEGAVDPTLGTALVAAGYDRDIAELGATGGRHRAPAVRRTARWQDVDLDEPALTLAVPPGVLLDLGATAKALAADLAAASAHEATGGAVLVSLCGDLAVRGTDEAEPWLVRVVERPDEVDGPLVEIRDGGLATSTTRARRWTRSGRPMHHLLDPVTGLPVREVWRTATVAAATCVDANIASTAAVVKGSGGLRWIEATGLPARLVAADGTVTCAGGWPTERQAVAS
jgi:thiamine biosynthesis lipoprotein ApbE